MSKVEVKMDGIVIGHTYDKGNTIEFLDNKFSQSIKHEMLTNRLAISARSIGFVKVDGRVEFDELIEMSVIRESNFPKKL